MRVPRRRGLFAALACAATLAAAACGSSAGSASVGASASSQIVIGDIGEYTGPLASGPGGFADALDAWASYVNADGGLDGHQVKLVNMDVGTSTEASASLTAAEQLITDDHAVAIIDADHDDATWLSYAAQQGVPVIGAVGQTTAAMVTPDSFPVDFSVVTPEFAVASLAKTFGPKFGAAYCAEAPACAGFATLFKEFGGPLGVRLAVAAPLSSSAPDYTAFCQELKDSGVDSYTLVLPPAVAARITTECYDQGVRVPQLLWAFSTFSSDKSQPAYNNDLVIDDMGAPYWDTSIPAVATMRAALEKYAPSVIGTQNDNSYLERAWVSGQLLAAAISKITGNVTSPSVKQELYSLKDDTLGGLTAPLTYTPAKPTTISCYYTWKVSGGQFIVPSGGSTPTCVPAALLGPVLSAVASSAGS